MRKSISQLAAFAPTVRKNRCAAIEAAVPPHNMLATTSTAAAQHSFMHRIMSVRRKDTDRH